LGGAAPAYTLLVTLANEAAKQQVCRLAVIR
jgi:hypothetical protein